MEWSGVSRKAKCWKCQSLPLTNSRCIDGIMFEDHKDGVLTSSFFCSPTCSYSTIPAGAGLCLRFQKGRWLLGWPQGSPYLCSDMIRPQAVIQQSLQSGHFRKHCKSWEWKGQLQLQSSPFCTSLTLFLINVIVRSVDLTLANLVFNLGSNTMGVNSGKLLKFTVPLFLYLQNGNKSTYIKISLRLNKNKIHVKPVHEC